MLKVHHLVTHNVLTKIWAFLVVSRVEFMVMWESQSLFLLS